MDSYNYKPSQLPRDPNPFIEVFTPDAYTNYSVVSDFSDLNITQIELTLNMEYALSKDLFLQGQFTVRDYQDGEEYLEDGDGTAVIGMVGLIWKL